MISVARHESYLRQTFPIRLGSLAADLARVASFAEINDVTAVESLLEESTAFIEWCAPGLVNEKIDDATRLVDIQRGLATWQLLWRKAQNESDQEKLLRQARAWSDEVLAMSGLLEQE
jgi:hypothetical protein